MDLAITSDLEVCPHGYSFYFLLLPLKLNQRFVSCGKMVGLMDTCTGIITALSGFAFVVHIMHRTVSLLPFDSCRKSYQSSPLCATLVSVNAIGPKCRRLLASTWPLMQAPRCARSSSSTLTHTWSSLSRSLAPPPRSVETRVLFICVSLACLKVVLEICHAYLLPTTCTG